MPGAAAFYFLRHGETDWNRDGRLQGWTDIPLNGLGVQQAEAAAAILAREPVRNIAMSHLRRVSQTAEPLVARTGLVPEVHQGLAERRNGEWEGQRQVEIDRSTSPAGGETYEEFSSRVITTVAPLVAAPGMLLISHGGVFRVLAAAVGVAVEGAVGNARPYQFCPEPGGDRWTIRVV